MKRGPGVLAVAMLLAAGTAGCSGFAPNACPALEWFNSVTVSDGSADKVHLVELCADDVCSVRADGPVRVPETSVSPGAVPAPVTALPGTALPEDGDPYGVLSRRCCPGAPRARAGLDPGGGSEACGGPTTAGPVRLVI